MTMATKPKLILELWSDEDVENPADLECSWTIYSFSRKHVNFQDPYDYFKRNGSGDWKTKALAKQAEDGRAFKLACYEHSGSVWALQGGQRHLSWPDQQWDVAQLAGVLLWQHPANELSAKGYASRAADAEIFLREYTAWCNGEGYGYTIVADEGEEIDSGGGYLGEFGTIEMFKQIKTYLAGKDCEVTIEGDCAWLASYHEWK